MILPASERIFDTAIDTNKILVSLKTYFRIRPKDSNPKRALVYLFITGASEKRERINYDIEINTIDWNSKTEMLFESCELNQDINLVLDNIRSKITKIKTNYRLQEVRLTPIKMRKELLEGMLRTNFVSYFRFALEEQKVKYGNGTYKRYCSVHEKLKKWKPEICFQDIDMNFFNKFRTYLEGLGNQKTTINGNIVVLKTFLTLASDDGIKLKFDLKKLVGGSTHGSRTYLTPGELNALIKFYNSEFITNTQKIVLGTFLFSCMTGLRISDLQKLKRKDLVENEASFINTKSQKDQYSSLNLTAQKIVKACPELFVRKYPDQYLNEVIKIIMKQCQITKTVSFHVARHTFATCFLRKEVGGSVHHLQKLLKHRNITTTMVYVHILESEANEQVFGLDKLFE